MSLALSTARIVEAGRGITCVAMLVHSAAIVTIVSRQLSGGVRVQRLVPKPDSQLTKGLT